MVDGGTLGLGTWLSNQVTNYSVTAGQMFTVVKENRSMLAERMQFADRILKCNSKKHEEPHQNESLFTSERSIRPMGHGAELAKGKNIAEDRFNLP